ncbi:DUF1796 family putative cysteine peptidase [Rhizobium sp. S152]|uniref:DUF1796 family putative cysteine peptidase n=1 Tax=Rhizobium sp. S152 TaxID=3055038 RepID=UPI0025A9EBBD|nr:DUF1796 family putative cysteine peptidase [Rhizobium sp. S152]MDM9625966.1 DUF1796 family putative cysteine peptidase [Rhizobium sp. S152]
MKHTYISLGSACNAATMIKRAGLRKVSYPFDWLLNSDSGLASVNEMIKDDFQKVTEADCYALSYQPIIGKDIVAYKDYQTVFHVHSNPMESREAHQDLVRRFERFRQIITSDESLHFVYYRNLSVSRKATPDITPLQLLEQMLIEANDFLSIILPIRRGGTSLLLVVEADVEDTQAVDEALRSLSISIPQISVARALSRYDDDKVLNLRWQREWMRLLIVNTDMPILVRIACTTRIAAKTARAAIRSWFKERFAFRSNSAGSPSSNR